MARTAVTPRTLARNAHVLQDAGVALDPTNGARSQARQSPATRSCSTSTRRSRGQELHRQGRRKAGSQDLVISLNAQRTTLMSGAASTRRPTGASSSTCRRAPPGRSGPRTSRTTDAPARGRRGAAPRHTQGQTPQAQARPGTAARAGLSGRVAPETPPLDAARTPRRENP